MYSPSSLTRAPPTLLNHSLARACTSRYTVAATDTAVCFIFFGLQQPPQAPGPSAARSKGFYGGEGDRRDWCWGLRAQLALTAHGTDVHIPISTFKSSSAMREGYVTFAPALSKGTWGTGGGVRILPTCTLECHRRTSRFLPSEASLVPRC